MKGIIRSAGIFHKNHRIRNISVLIDVCQISHHFCSEPKKQTILPSTDMLATD